MAKNSKKSKSFMVYLNGNSDDSKASYTVKSLLYIFIPLHFINVKWSDTLLVSAKI